MLKTFAGALALTGAMLIVQPSAQAACLEGASAALTQEMSAQTTVRTKTVVKKKGPKKRVVVRTKTYAAPKYYGYYGPMTYDRPYARPRPVVLGLGGWW
jgi:hypothetical protein